MTLSPSSLATSAPLDVGRSPRTTFEPARANRSTVARPKPEAPPVTNATALFYYKIENVRHKHHSIHTRNE